MTQNLYFFTVLTPTYNRAHTLERVYQSLCEQQFKDFEWLVVDDGSTDNTRNQIETWQVDSPFPIRYVWQTNQHKKTAFNTGVREAWGRLIVALDSDDTLLPDSLQSMADVWRGIPDDLKSGYIAVTGLCARSDGGVVGDRFPEDVMDMTSLDMYFKCHVKGEKFGCLQTQVLKHYPFPEDIDGFVPESMVWRAIARDGYLTRFVNKVFRTYYESDDSLSNEGVVSGEKHALGILLLARDTIVHCLPWFRYQPATFLLAAARYTRFRMHLQHAGKPLPQAVELQGNMSRILVSLMYPIGWAQYLRDCRKHG